jgi:hypothetical protein
VFPSSLTSWTVRAHSISHYQLETQVYCLQAYPSLDVRLVKASSCSSGTIQVSGGYDSDVRYVLCAARFITPGPTANSIRVGSLKVECMNQATGTNLSESRTFSYTCQWH